jgi:hypothetical protein
MTAPEPPDHLQIVCPGCAALREPVSTLLAVDVDDEQVVCETCSSSFRVATRFVSRSQPHAIDRATTRYELHTVEAGGRVRPRLFEAQAGLRLRGSTWVTFVWQRQRMVGVADQTNSMWNPLLKIPSRMPAFERGCQLLLGVCGLIAALYAIAWSTELKDFAASGSGSLTALAVVAIVAAAPLIWWTVRTGFGEDVGRKRILPRFRGD